MREILDEEDKQIIREKREGVIEIKKKDFLSGDNWESRSYIHIYHIYIRSYVQEVYYLVTEALLTNVCCKVCLIFRYITKIKINKIYKINKDLFMERRGM